MQEYSQKIMTNGNIKRLYLAAGLLLFGIRWWLNFRQELLPGVNGGYYPVQIRSILENGRLGFPDMPLFFYLNALVITVVSWLSNSEAETIILSINKMMDSLSLPLIVLPLYLIRTRLFHRSLPLYFELLLMAFATLSFGPLILTSELQKNAAAMPLLAFFLYYLLSFFRTQATRTALYGGLFFLLTGLTHFGAFAVALAALLTGLFVFYRAKAIVPSILLGLTGLGLVFLFDPVRALRLLQSLSVVFERPAILSGRLSPLTIFHLLTFYPVLVFGWLRIRREALGESPFEKNAFLVFSILLVILTAPVLDDQYAMRFNLMTFVPAFFILLLSFEWISPFWQKGINIVLLLVISASLFTLVGHPRTPSLTAEAFRDLETLREQIEAPERTLVVARHGLEWWAAWQLKTHVGQETAVDEQTFYKYERVISLSQKEAEQFQDTQQPQPFPNPYSPPDRPPVYESDFFKAVELRVEDLPAVKASAKRSKQPPSRPEPPNDRGRKRRNDTPD